MNASTVQQELKRLGNPQKAIFVTKYFKTGKGEYGEGDTFLGVTVPAQRLVAKKYRDVPLSELKKLIESTIHEHKQTGLMILALQFQKAPQSEKRKIYDFYLSHTKYINNWDLIDGSSPIIVGGYLQGKPKERIILYKLAKSKSLWQRRIAILATYTFLKQKDFADTLAISEILLHDTHDLIHKAVGWMLREVGKMDQAVEENFLKKYHKVMPRTMLRYAIERFPPQKRLAYLHRP